MSLFVMTKEKPCPERPAPERKIPLPDIPKAPKFVVTIYPPEREAPKRDDVKLPEPLKDPKPKFKVTEFEFKEMREKVIHLKETYQNEDELLTEYLQILPEVRKVLRKNVTIESIIACPIGEAYFMKFLQSEVS